MKAEKSSPDRHQVERSLKNDGWRVYSCHWLLPTVKYQLARGHGERMELIDQDEALRIYRKKERG